MGNTQKYRIPGPNKTLYEGECNEEGKPHGEGLMKYSQNCYFKGKFENGSPKQGNFVYQNGDTYNGQIKNNKPQGTGTWTDKTGTYKGQFKNGEFISGEILYSDGSKYFGCVIDGQKSGTNGQFTYKDGDKFVGQFYCDQFKNGVYTTKDGAVYNGMFKNGWKEGKGVLEIPGVLKYEGEFKEDKFDGTGQLQNIKLQYHYVGNFLNNNKSGQGILTDLKNKTKYEGQFLNNEKNGFGKYSFNNNKRKYEGNFRNNKFNGKGKLIYSNGDYYQGEFLDNMKHGNGYLCLQSCRQYYNGEFKDDMMQGKGNFQYSNGDTYAGNFSKNKKNGQGIYTRANGEILKGLWQSDRKHGAFEQYNPNSKLKTKGQYKMDERDGKFYINNEDRSQKSNSKVGGYGFEDGETVTYVEEWKDGVKIYQ